MIHLLYRPAAARGDGVGDYTRNLRDALDAEGAEAVLWAYDGRGWQTPTDDEPRASPSWRPGEWALLQYSPFGLGRGGIAPWTVRTLVRARRAGVRPAMVVHEPYVAAGAGRAWAMSAAQRAQLAMLMAMADQLIVPCEAWTRYLRRIGLRDPRRVEAICVGSNLPEPRLDPSSARERLGIAEQATVACAFGTAHDSRLGDHVVAALEMLRARRSELVFLSLGAGGALPGVHRDVRQLAPGWQAPQEVSDALAAADVALLPFVDGVSGRRTSVASALQHGLATVTTAGRHTESWWRDAGVSLADPEDARSFAAAAARAVQDHGAAADRPSPRAVFEARFAWDVIARAMRRVLPSPERGRRA